MSRTDKDSPTRVRAAADPSSHEIHYCTEHGPSWRHRRWVTETTEHEPAWYLATEIRIRDTNTWFTEDEWARAGRTGRHSVLPVTTRRRWVFGPRTVTTEHLEHVHVPCDIDDPGRARRLANCVRWPADERLYGWRPGRLDRREMFHKPVRAATRAALREAAADWNTHGDTDIEPAPVSWSTPASGGWWD